MGPSLAAKGKMVMVTDRAGMVEVACPLTRMVPSTRTRRDQVPGVNMAGPNGDRSGGSKDEDHAPSPGPSKEKRMR